MIAFYPTLGQDDMRKDAPAVSRMLLPVSSWAGYKLRQQKRQGLTQEMVIGRIPVPHLPESMRDIAADCGGFVATRIWGDYKYSPDQYAEWLREIKPSWAATMDYCCEDEITNGRPGIVRERQQKTTEMAWHFWRTYQESWCWVPTIQGWEVEDYQRHAIEMKPIIQEMQAVYADNLDWRVGIGTLCNRASIQMIHDVTRAVAAILPGVPLHLWGIKLGALQSPLALPEQVVSVDSAIWDEMYGRGNEEWKKSGLRRRQWAFDVALPRYEAKVAAALAQPKQLMLADCEAI